MYFYLFPDGQMQVKNHKREKANLNLVKPLAPTTNLQRSQDTEGRVKQGQRKDVSKSQTVRNSGDKGPNSSTNKLQEKTKAEKGKPID